MDHSHRRFIDDFVSYMKYSEYADDNVTQYAYKSADSNEIEWSETVWENIRVLLFFYFVTKLRICVVSYKQKI